MVLSPSETRSSFARYVLEIRGARFIKELTALKRRIAGESVHDTRVSSRRMRAALTAFRDLFPGDRWQDLYREVRRVTRTLGVPREVEVLIARLHELGAAGDMAEGISREYLDEGLRRELSRQQRRMSRRLRRLNARSLRSRIFALLGELGPPPAAAAHAGMSERSGSGRQTGRSLQPSLFQLEESPLERGERVLPSLAAPVVSFQVPQGLRHPSDARLHRLRIDVKKLRYALEIFDEANPGVLAPLIAGARRLQEAAGDHQDWAVLCERLRGETRRLTRQGSNHLSYQVGRLLEAAETRRADARRDIYPVLAALQSGLGEFVESPRNFLARPAPAERSAGVQP